MVQIVGFTLEYQEHGKLLAEVVRQGGVQLLNAVDASFCGIRIIPAPHTFQPDAHIVVPKPAYLVVLRDQFGDEFVHGQSVEIIISRNISGRISIFMIISF